MPSNTGSSQQQGSTAVLTALAEADAADMPPPASVAEQSDSEQTVPSPAQAKAVVMLGLDAEIAGLLEAADMPADRDKQITKPDAIPPAQGGGLGRAIWLLQCLACAVFLPYRPCVICSPALCWPLAVQCL